MVLDCEVEKICFARFVLAVLPSMIAFRRANLLGITREWVMGLTLNIYELRFSGMDIELGQ